jgi:DNA-binding response OmpR family regulator
MTKNKLISVQDDELLNKVLSREIGNDELEVCEVYSGKEGLAMICEQDPILVILDPLVPEMDGFTILQELKSNDKTKDIPVIVITILAGEEDMKKFMDLGVKEYKDANFNVRYRTES